MITTILRRRFVINPYLLREAIKHFSGAGQAIQFYNLVRDFMPGELDKMLKMAPEDAAKQFVKIFSKQYFPIKGQEYTYVSCLQTLLDRIPMEWRGLGEYGSGAAAYEGFNKMSKAQLLAETILACPFSHSTRAAVVDRFIMGFEDREAAVALVGLINNTGWDPEDVEDVLEDSPYRNFVPWVQWVFASTGNIWLDTSNHYGTNSTWDKESVLELARQWQLYLKIKEDMDVFSAWLTADFLGRSAKVIEYISTGFGKRLVNVLSEEKHDSKG